MTFWFLFANKSFDITPFRLFAEVLKLKISKDSIVVSSNMNGRFDFRVEFPETIVVMVELYYLQFST